MTYSVRYPLVRPLPAVDLLDVDSFARAAGAHPGSGPPARRPRPARRRSVTADGDLWFSPGRGRRASPGSSGCGPAWRSTTPPSASSSTCSTGSPHWKPRPPAPEQAAPAQHDAAREANRGTEPLDPEVARGPGPRADQGAALRSPRGRWRAPPAGADRPARRTRALSLLSDDGHRSRPTGGPTSRTSCPAARVPPVRASAPSQISVTQRLSRLLDWAEHEAKRLKDEYVSVEHLVIAFLDEGSPFPRRAALLHEQGVARVKNFLESLTAIRGNQRVTSAIPRRPRTRR